jgi:putative glycosyltransferase (TIGR04372 family)
MTDTYLLWGTLRADDLFIPKKLWLISEKRLLTFREMLAVGPLYMYQANCLRDGIELVHNTPDEISAVVLEMEQRLNGAWKSSEEDEELQHRFKSLYPPRVSLRVDERHDFFKPNVRIPGRIGAEFLRQYVHLLN